MSEYPILGFAPDLPQDMQGVLTSSAQIVPTERGIASSPYSPTALGSFVTGNPCGGAYFTKIDGTTRVFLGVNTKIYEWTTSAVDRSGAAYNASISQTWSFAQFGDVSLAINKGDVLQASTTGNFAAVSGAPKGSIVITPGEPNFQFAMVFDYDDGTNNFGDGIFWSAGSNYADWTPSIATQCGNVRLTDRNGAFTAAIPFRDGVLAFKANATYLGQYVGGSAVWSWQRIATGIGCIGKDAVCAVEDAIYFADSGGVWIYDGSYPRPCPGFVHKWLADRIATSARLTYDKGKHQLWLRYSDNGFGVGNHLVYNTRAERWTQHAGIASSDGSVNHLISSPRAGLQYGVIGLATAQFALMGTSTPAAQFQLAAHGNTYGMTTFRSIRPQFIVGPSDTATGWLNGTLFYGPSVRNISNGSAAMSFKEPGRLDIVKQARFVAPFLSFAAGTPWEISKIAIDLSFNPTGE